MKGFNILLSYGFKRRIKDSFVIIFNVVYPIVLIMLLAYLATNYFKGDSSVTSSYYYVIVLIPFFIFTNMITAAYAAKDENINKTSYRFLIAPIDNAAIVLSKIISITVVSWGCNIVLLVIVRLLLKVNLGSSAMMILLLFLVENFMAAAIGIFLGVTIKNFNTIQGVLNIPIAVFGILGGSFFPVGSMGSTFEKVSYISPFTWFNRGIISSVYDKDQTILLYSIISTLAVGILFSIAATLSFKKEEFL